MNKKINQLSLLVLMSIILIVSGCESDETKKISSKSSYLMGTLVKITIDGKVEESVYNEIFSHMKFIEEKVSTKIESSELSQINQQAGQQSVKVSDETYQMIKRGLYYAELSNGYFDITIGPLVALWGIGTENAKLPEEDNLNQVIPLTDYKKVILNEDTQSVKLEKYNMMIDLGGIAKGYAADYAAKMLKEQGINHAIINLGGNILTIGAKSNGDQWKVGLQDPFEERNKTFGIIKSENLSIVTSGIYERFFLEDDKRYHHILDPFTGYPIENDLAGVTILSKQSVDGDALSTTAFALGLEKGYALISNLDGVEAVFVTKDREVYVTQGAETVFELTHTGYTLKQML